MGRSRLWRRLFVISGLSAAAIAAPLLDIYGRNPEVFVANRTSPVEIVVFSLLIALVVPLLALIVLRVAETVGGSTPEVVYSVMVWLLAVALGLIVSRQVFSDNTFAAVVLAVVVAAVVIALYRRFEGVLVYFALAVPLVLVMFLATSASARLIWATDPGPGSTTTGIGSPAPIVMIQLDEMPISSLMGEDGEVNEVLFPNFARLAAEGTWYRNALSSSIATTQSVPAIMTGRLGEKGMSPSSIDHPDNLFTLLDGKYDMHVIEWVAEMCPEDVCPDYAGRAPARFSSLVLDVGVVYGHLTLPVEMREELPSIDNAWKGFLGQSDRTEGLGVEVEGLPVPPAGERAAWVDWMQRIINGIDNGSRPVLSYAHLQAPHVPWQTNPSGTHYERPEEYTEVEGVEGDGRWGPDPEPAIMGFQRHLYQLGFLDRMLGRLLGRLDDTGTWDETMVIVVADHGASFVPGQHRRWPYEDNRQDLYRVPLFVKYPGQDEGEIRDEPVYGIDILPTIVDVLEIDTDWTFDGISLRDVAGTNRPHEPVWWCCNGDGVDTDITHLLGQVRRNHSWIPDQSSWSGVAGVGPHADLVGQPVTALEVRQSDGLRWSLDFGVSLAEVEEGSGKLQTLLTGRVELPSDVEGDELLVAVNGRIAGAGYVSRDSSTGGALRGLITEELVSAGQNEVDILVLSDDGSTWVAGSAGVLSLDLVSDDGRALELSSEGARRIQVDSVTPTDSGWMVEGWAADVHRKVVADRIYVFAGDSLVASGPPDVENANVVRWFDSDDLLVSGFAFDIPDDNIPNDLEQLTVVAEFEDYAVGDPARLAR